MKSFSQLISEFATVFGNLESIDEQLSTYKVPVEVSAPHGGISMTKHIHVDAKSPDHAKKVASKYVRDRGHKLHSVGTATLKEDVDIADDLGTVVEDTSTIVVVEQLRPDFYRVIQGVEGHLDEGDTIHATHLEEMEDLGFDISVVDADGDQIEEISKDLANRYVDKALADRKPASADPGDPKQLKNALHNLKRSAGVDLAIKKATQFGDTSSPHSVKVRATGKF